MLLVLEGLEFVWLYFLVLIVVAVVVVLVAVVVVFAAVLSVAVVVVAVVVAVVLKKKLVKSLQAIAYSQPFPGFSQKWETEIKLLLLLWYWKKTR